jgi:hypothetical protein
MNVPGLDERIAAHGAALTAGDDRSAESFVSPSALEEYGAVMRGAGAHRPFERGEPLALARIGAQYVSKIRLHGHNATVTLLVRWRQETDGGRWVIAATEDLSGKRSPWSDIPHYAAQRTENRNG